MSPIARWISRRDRFGWLVCFRIQATFFVPASLAASVSSATPGKARCSCPRNRWWSCREATRWPWSGADNKVSLRTVQVGERSGAMWIVNQGLKPQERVVVEGVQKVRDSMQVNPTFW